MSPAGRAALALWLLAGPALGQDATDLAPESAPTPEARPDEGGGEAPAAEAADSGTDGGDEAAEVVDDSESGEAVAPAAEGTAEEEEPDLAEDEAPAADLPELVPPEEEAPEEEPAGPPMPERLAESEAELEACLAELDALGVAYERAEPVSEPGSPDCGIANPVTVEAIAPGVALEPASTMRCATALAAARWAADVAVPLAGRLGRGPLVAIDQGTAYLCRPRADGAVSEHAYGNALDIMAFRFAEGDPIPVEPRAGDGTLEEAFQRAVRAGACLDFATVLGPGSDEDHADHLHFDIKLRERGFRICE